LSRSSGALESRGRPSESFVDDGSAPVRVYSESSVPRRGSGFGPTMGIRTFWSCAPAADFPRTTLRCVGGVPRPRRRWSPSEGRPGGPRSADLIGRSLRASARLRGVSLRDKPSTSVLALHIGPVGSREESLDEGPSLTNLVERSVASDLQPPSRGIVSDRTNVQNFRRSLRESRELGERVRERIDDLVW
jgi:hypothetical protein